MIPNFEEYSLEELKDVKENIDEELYPERYKIICDLILKINNGSHTPIPKEEIPDFFDSDKPVRNTDTDGIYIPNSLATKEIRDNIIVCLFLIAYGIYGLMNGEIVIPVTRGGGEIYVYGNGIWLANGAFLCGCIFLMSYVVDHFDKRDNEISYYKFRTWVKYLGIFLLVLACIISYPLSIET